MVLAEVIMTRKKMPDLALLRSLVDYSPEDGKFRWESRPVNLFPSPRSQRMWNTRFSGKEAFNTQHHAGYLYGSLFGSNYSAHRLAWYISKGEEPDEIDHINGDRADNRLANLRSVDRAENCKNSARRRESRSGETGVTWDRVNSKWHVRVGRKHVGRFRSFADAVEARRKFANIAGYHPNHGR